MFLCRRSAGFESKESLSYDDFKTMMKEFKGDFLAIGLDCKGARQNYLDSTTNVARMQSFGLDSIAERQKSSMNDMNNIVFAWIKTSFL